MLKWAFLIACCPPSVRLSVCKPFTFSSSSPKLLGQFQPNLAQSTTKKLKNPLSTTRKLGTKHPWVKGIQICSNGGPRLFPRGRKWRNSENTLKKFKNPILTKVDEVFSKKDHSIVKKGIIFFLLLNLIIAFRKCAFWCKLYLRWAMWPMGLLYLFSGFSVS